MAKCLKRQIGLKWSCEQFCLTKRNQVLAISGSLRMPSFTEKILDTLIEGMGEAEAHKYYPHKMKIGPCTSCWRCWQGKNKGECVQKDDFQLIYDVFKRCDYFIIAAPVYVFGFPATVKNVIDRFFINLESSQFLMDNGITTHPHRVTPKAKGVLVSSCGFPDMENFALMSQHFKKFIMTMGLTWAGEILIPSAGQRMFLIYLIAILRQLEKLVLSLRLELYLLKQCKPLVMSQYPKKITGI